jgi:glutathione S-transferase
VVNYLEPPGYQIAGPIFFNRAQESAEEIHAGIEPLHAELKLMEATLSHSPWLAGASLVQLTSWRFRSLRRCFARPAKARPGHLT